MRAIVLVGGEGTRLRPLTLSSPKPLLPFCNRPFLDRLLDRLDDAGVDEAVLSSPYLESAFSAFLESRGERGPRVRWIHEPEPLGTGGAVAHAAREAGIREDVFVLNGDVLTDLDLGALLEAHRAGGASGTITLTPVADARPYGLVSQVDGRVERFLEKPPDPVPGDINAGTYVLTAEALDAVPPGRSVSIERETFPALIERGSGLRAFVSDAYWTDLGTPERYLDAHADALEGRIAGIDVGAPLVDPAADVAAAARLDGTTVVGPGTVVAPGAAVSGSVVFEGGRIERGAVVERCIVGAGARIGLGSRLSGCVVGDDARVGASEVLEDARVA